MATIIKAPNKMSAPLPGTPYLPPPVLVSDTFSGSGKLTGRVADCLLGGSPMVWQENNPGYFEIVNGYAQRITEGTNGIQGFDTGMTDFEVGLTLAPIAHGGSSATLYMDARRNGHIASGEGYRITISISTGISVTRRAPGGGTSAFIPAAAANAIKSGDRVAFRIVGGVGTLYLNGVNVGTATDPSPLTGTWATFSNSGGGYSVDDFYIQKAVNRA